MTDLHHAKRWPWLLLILIGHGLLYWSWPRIHQRGAEGRHAMMEMVLLLNPTKAARPDSPAATVTEKERKHVQAATAATQTSAGNTTASQAPSATVSNIESDPAPIVANVPLNLDLGKISQEISGKSGTQFAAKPAAHSFAAFEQNVAAAARPRETTTKTFKLADGTLVTKVTTPNGTYCVYGRNVGGNIIAREREYQTMDCGNL